MRATSNSSWLILELRHNPGMFFSSHSCAGQFVLGYAASFQTAQSWSQDMSRGLIPPHLGGVR